MQKFVSRLIDCGIPAKTAVCICNHFKRKNLTRELELYIEEVERECHECMV